VCVCVCVQLKQSTVTINFIRVQILQFNHLVHKPGRIQIPLISQDNSFELK
jgi:hypothetical protein